MSPMILHLCAPNDGNGNPRRCYVLFTDGRPTHAWDEGYAGSHTVPLQWRALANIAWRIDCTVKSYREFMKLSAD